MIKLASASEAAPPASPTAQAQGIQPVVTLPPQLALLADTLKTMLDQVTGPKMPEDTGDQAEAVVAQLKTQLSSSLQPILGDTPIPGNKYGPVTPGGHAVRLETAPYQSLEASKEPGAASTAAGTTEG